MVRRQLHQLLELVRQEINCLARMSEARRAYHLEADGGVAPELRFLSPLAEGADRLGAEVALELGYALYVPMPFRRCEYLKDFAHDAVEPGSKSSTESGSVAAFRTLLGRATSVLELDGGRDDPAHDRYDEARSYEAVGRFVVRNCDLLIAIWNGKPGRGRGGTADIMQFAADTGPPIWWIHADRDNQPAWIGDASEMRDPKPDFARAKQQLRGYFERLILPPQFSPQSDHAIPVIDHIAHIGRPPADPLAAFFTETPLPRRWWAQAYRLLMKCAAGGFEPGWYDPPAPEGQPVSRCWYEAYQAPDKRAGEYASRYRSTYVWVFALAALALACAALALSVPATAGVFWHAVKFTATAAELAALLLVLWLVIVNIRHEWHPRSIDYRLLAELCRKQQALALLGWSLSGRAVQALVEQHEDGGTPDRAAWVIWLFAAMSRAAPTLSGVFDPERCGRARALVLRDLIEEQTEYHAARLRLCDHAGHSFVALGLVLFFPVIAIVITKLAVLLFWPGAASLGVPLGVFATILPALAAAVIGVRAYAELELLADQSRSMKSAMQRAKQRINKLDLTRPLASQELGVEVLDVATRMLQDVDGWARLFRVKLVEAG